MKNLLLFTAMLFTMSISAKKSNEPPEVKVQHFEVDEPPEEEEKSYLEQALEAYAKE